MKSFRTLYGIFFLSGATGLVYEVIWVRLTGLVFGNTSHAIAVVLGAFMAGLALGSWKLGRYADRVPSALKLYGMLEIGIGIAAALVPFVFQSLHSVYWALTPYIQGIPGAKHVSPVSDEFRDSSRADIPDGRNASGACKVFHADRKGGAAESWSALRAEHVWRRIWNPRRRATVYSTNTETFVQLCSSPH